MAKRHYAEWGGGEAFCMAVAEGRNARNIVQRIEDAGSGEEAFAIAYREAKGMVFIVGDETTTDHLRERLRIALEI